MALVISHSQVLKESNCLGDSSAGMLRAGVGGREAGDSVESVDRQQKLNTAVCPCH